MTTSTIDETLSLLDDLLNTCYIVYPNDNNIISCYIKDKKFYVNVKTKEIMTIDKNTKVFKQYDDADAYIKQRFLKKMIKKCDD